MMKLIHELYQYISLFHFPFVWSNSEDSIQTQLVVSNIIMYNVNMFIQMHRVNGTHCESTQRQVMKIGFN